MSNIRLFLQRHALPDRISAILQQPFIYIFDDGDEWSGTITGIRVESSFSGFVINLDGWYTDFGYFTIEEVDLPLDNDHDSASVKSLRRKTHKVLQLVDEIGEYHPGTFMLISES